MKLLLIAGLLAMVSASAAVTGPANGWPLNTESIKDAARHELLARKLDPSRAQIFPPPEFTTRRPNPELELRSIQENRERNVLFAVFRCRERRACGSFLVEIRLADPSVREAKQRTLLTTFSLSDNGGREVTSTGAREPALVQPRIPAWLVIEQGGLRITEPVWPLKPARLGEVVRVNDPVTHRSMLAEVTGPGLLRPADENREAHSRGMP